MLVYQSDNSMSHEHMRVEYYLNFSFFPHLHRDLEFVLVLEGEVNVDAPGGNEIVRAGQLALFLSNQVHAFSTPEFSRVFVVNFSVGYVNTFIRQVEGKVGACSVFDSTQALTAYLYDIYMKEPHSLPDALTFKASCYAVCARFLQCVPLKDAPQANDSVLHQLLSYVEENYKENISMKSAAKAIGYDENYLSRYFHQSVNINFRRYVNQYRIDYACRLMEEKDKRLSDIAFECGFQNIRSFNRAFIEIVKKTPSEYLSNQTGRKNTR